MRIEKLAYSLPFAVALMANAQTAVVTQQPNILNKSPDGTGNYEKVIGHFTSTSHLSYFLGTANAAYIIDPSTGIQITVAVDGAHYERAKAYKAGPNDQFDSLIASAGSGTGQLVAYWNPANWNGGNANAAWGKFVIYSGSGCHDIYVLDVDGDGNPDVVCSGTYYDNNAPAFIAFQNTYNNWSVIQPIHAGDGIAPIAVNGWNGGRRNSLVACYGSTLYAYKNPGGSASRNPGNWAGYPVGDCNQGVSIGTLPVSGRDIIVVASNEDEPTQWSSGFSYFDPGTGSNPSWHKVTVDHTYTSTHQVACDVLNGTPFCTLGEQEQANYSCNADNYDTQSQNGGTYAGCRVAIYAWTGTGFGPPTYASSKGTQNQALYQVNGIEYMAGANHCVLGGYNCAYHLWTFTFNAGMGNQLTSVAFSSGGLTMDAGWALNPSWGSPDYIGLWTYNDGQSQLFNWTANGKLQSVANTSMYLYNKGGYLALGTSGDLFAVNANGTIQDTSASGSPYLHSSGSQGAGAQISIGGSASTWTQSH